MSAQTVGLDVTHLCNPASSGPASPCQRGGLQGRSDERTDQWKQILHGILTIGNSFVVYFSSNSFLTIASSRVETIPCLCVSRTQMALNKGPVLHIFCLLLQTHSLSLSTLSFMVYIHSLPYTLLLVGLATGCPSRRWEGGREESELVVLISRLPSRRTGFISLSTSLNLQESKLCSSLPFLLPVTFLSSLL